MRLRFKGEKNTVTTRYCWSAFIKMLHKLTLHLIVQLHQPKLGCFVLHTTLKTRVLTNIPPELIDGKISALAYNS